MEKLTLAFFSGRHMDKRKSLLFTAWVSLLLVAGCGKQQQHETPGQVCVPEANKAQAMTAAENVLTGMHFSIEKFDTERGLIRTSPLPGAKFFEIWRSDNVGADNRLLSNLHSIRRTAQVEITRQGSQLCIACDVRLQRLSLPEHQVSSSSRTYQMFSQSTGSLQQLTLQPEQRRQAAWVDLDSDTELASEIVRRIEKNLATRKNNEHEENK